MDMTKLREAIEASWKPDTAYHHVKEKGNPALGQCYVTSRVVQHYFPEAEIVEGEVLTDKGIEKHFWNMIITNNQRLHIDLTWQQFHHGSSVKNWKVRNRLTLNDSQQTIDRFDLLLKRVKDYLASQEV
jgi:hypothetical protein